MTTSELVHWSARRLSAAIARREVSCVEVMTASLDHIERVNPTYNAIVSIRSRDDLLAQARDCDAELMSGHVRGWLHGVPYAAKDLEDVAGLPTTFGLLRPDEVGRADHDSLPVARVRAAGAVFIGKTNTPQLGLGSHTFNDVFGATRNPWNPAWSAGGSSGGAAAAVALHLVPVADGSDFFGSLRNPAGWCQVYGLRPTPGVVPAADGDPFQVPGGVVGPMARSAGDLGGLLTTMAGPDRGDPWSWPTDPQLTEQIDGVPRPTRVGWLGDLDGYLPTAEGLLTATTRALAPLTDLGASMEPVSLDSPVTDAEGFVVERDLWPTWLTFRHWQVGTGLLALNSDPALVRRLKPEARFEVEGLLGSDEHPGIGPHDLAECTARRIRLLKRFQSLFDRFDLLLAPTSQVFPFPVDQRWPSQIGDTPMTTYHRWMEVTAPATLVGLPVLGLPLGRDVEGRPIGAQVIAPHHREDRLLQFAHAWEGVAGPPPVPASAG